jgi:hypothetical protein
MVFVLNLDDRFASQTLADIINSALALHHHQIQFGRDGLGFGRDGLGDGRKTSELNKNCARKGN